MELRSGHIPDKFPRKNNQKKDQCNVIKNTSKVKIDKSAPTQDEEDKVSETSSSTLQEYSLNNSERNRGTNFNTRRHRKQEVLDLSSGLDENTQNMMLSQQQQKQKQRRRKQRQPRKQGEGEDEQQYRHHRHHHHHHHQRLRRQQQIDLHLQQQRQQEERQEEQQSPPLSLSPDSAVQIMIPAPTVARQLLKKSAVYFVPLPIVSPHPMYHFDYHVHQQQGEIIVGTTHVRQWQQANKVTNPDYYFKPIDDGTAIRPAVVNPADIQKQKQLLCEEQWRAHQERQQQQQEQQQQDWEQRSFPNWRVEDSSNVVRPPGFWDFLSRQHEMEMKENADLRPQAKLYDVASNRKQSALPARHCSSSVLQSMNYSLPGRSVQQPNVEHMRKNPNPNSLANKENVETFTLESDSNMFEVYSHTGSIDSRCNRDNIVNNYIRLPEAVDIQDGKLIISLGQLSDGVITRATDSSLELGDFLRETKEGLHIQSGYGGLVVRNGVWDWIEYQHNFLQERIVN